MLECFGLGHRMPPFVTFVRVVLSNPRETPHAVSTPGSIALPSVVRNPLLEKIQKSFRPRCPTQFRMHARACTRICVRKGSRCDKLANAMNSDSTSPQPPDGTDYADLVARMNAAVRAASSTSVTASRDVTPPSPQPNCRCRSCRYSWNSRLRDGAVPKCCPACGSRKVERMQSPANGYNL